MQDLHVEDTLRIVKNTTSSKNFIIIILAIIGIYILYQTVMLIYHSTKLRKLGRLQKRSNEARVVTDNRSRGIEQSTTVSSKVADDERKDDIRTLLRGKR